MLPEDEDVRVIQLHPLASAPRGPRRFFAAVKKIPYSLSRIIIATLIIVLGTVIGYTLYLGTLNQSNANNNFAQPVDVANWDNYDGKFITGKLPPRWEIQEFMDGELGSSTLLKEGHKYEGITGIVVFNAQSQPVFRLESGGKIPAGCIKISKFRDTPEEYIATRLELNKATNGSTEVFDYTKFSYYQFTLLGRPFRRIGEEIFWDVGQEANKFSPQCNPYHSYGGLSYTDNGKVNDMYRTSLISGTATSDLLLLDTLLSNLQLKQT
jgi:hypothetical protein